ncbi:MAG: hypothetical protein CMN56_13015 [Sneathiella sp.]|uniref:hypothetical protein n=1 Tax=Sneathiella sp. TaxID=1964365 RepID=UPI000C59056A|nr:hypothetical protein [Sneathiella sp.]MAZ04045.1 hypothetical protein [Sneathiella sp.]
MKSGVIAVLCLLLLTACAAPKIEKVTYSAASPNAMIAVLDYRIKTNSVAIIRKVDMAKGEVYGKPYFLRDKETTSTPAYLLKELPSGTYAITQTITQSVMPFRTSTLCKLYKPAIEVFEIFPGKVNEVKLGHLKPGVGVTAPDLEKVLKSFPGISAPVQQAQLLGLLETKTLPNDKCMGLRNDTYKLKLLKIKQGTTA